jgi:hypothetical protein
VLGRRSYGPAAVNRQYAGRQEEESAEHAHDGVTVTARARDGDKFRWELRNGPAHSPPVFKRGPVQKPVPASHGRGRNGDGQGCPVTRGPPGKAALPVFPRRFIRFAPAPGRV